MLVAIEINWLLLFVRLDRYHLVYNSVEIIRSLNFLSTQRAGGGQGHLVPPHVANGSRFLILPSIKLEEDVRLMMLVTKISLILIAIEWGKRNKNVVIFFIFVPSCLSQITIFPYSCEKMHS